MAAINIPVIKKDEYVLFRDSGIRSQFPIDYSTFVEMFGKENKKITDSGVIPVYIEIDFAGFRQWLGTGKYATYNDLLRYAATFS